MHGWGASHSDDGSSASPREDSLKSRHHCTDTLCCLLFVLALGCFGWLYRQCLLRGNISKLYHGIDYQGRVCGLDDDVEDKPYLYWCAGAAPNGGSMTFNTAEPICVDHCPDGSLSNSIFSVKTECALISGSLSRMFPYRTMVLLDRYCMPDTEDDKGASQKITMQLNNFDIEVQEVLSSLPSSTSILVCTFFVAVVLGYVYLALLRHCAELLIWLSMLACIAGFALFGAYLWTHAATLLQGVSGSAALLEDIKQVKGHEEVATRIAAAVCWVLALLLCCTAYCLHHSIQLAAACVEVACEALFEMPSLLLAPVCKVVLKGLVFVALLYGFLLLWSICDMVKGDNGVARHFSPSGEQKAALVYYAIMSLWILVFLSALYQFIIAYAVAVYYYTPLDHRGRKDVGCCKVYHGLQVGLVYHSGSLAFGSLLITLLWALQRLVQYAERQNKSTVNNQLVTMLLCCIGCFVDCCKELVQRVSKSAYIDMAITSSGFCEAAQEALSVITRIAASMGILTGASILFSFFGLVLICLGSGIFAYIMTKNQELAEVDSPVVTAYVAMSIGALVGIAFMDVFDMAADTLLYCYGLDMQKGTDGRTAPAMLKELFHAS